MDMREFCFASQTVTIIFWQGHWLQNKFYTYALLLFSVCKDRNVVYACGFDQVRKTQGLPFLVIGLSKSGGFHVKSAQNLHEIRTKSAGFHEIWMKTGFHECELLGDHQVQVFFRRPIRMICRISENATSWHHGVMMQHNDVMYDVARQLLQFVQTFIFDICHALPYRGQRLH